jgi:DNA-binding IclR family transcriptional regulator
MLGRRYLKKLAGDRWGLGDEMHALAMSTFGLGAVVAEVEMVLSALQEETQETVQLLVLNKTRALIIHVFSSSRSILLSCQSGTEIPVNWTAAGYLLVSGLGDRALRHFLLAHARPSPTRQAVTVADLLVRNVRTAGRRGYWIEIEQAFNGAGSIAAPVISAQGNCIAAVSLVLPVARLLNSQDSLVSLVRSAAAKLSRGLAAVK